MPRRNFFPYGACALTLGVLLLLPLLLPGCAQEEELPPQLQLKERAQQGDKAAMVEMGKQLCCGIGEGKDEERAVAWFCQAAREGSPEAQFVLGRMHQEEGLPLAAASIYQPVRVHKENSIAYAWYRLAALGGHRLAETALALLKRNMNNTQMNEGETLALDPRAIPCQYQGQTL